jgi:glycosyltransferase involved in cell wall biosynthesis
MVIHNGIDRDLLLEQPRNAPAETAVLFSAGRLKPIKGYDLLIRALPLLHRFSCRLVLAGDGPERENLERLADTLGVADRVHFVGHSHDVRTLLSKADAYVAPSRSEGMSNSIIEAMAAGVPIVATAVGGNIELVRGAGWLVPANNPSALTQGIERALSERAQTNHFVNEARKRVRRHYTMDRVVDAHEALYRERLARKRIETMVPR